MGSTVGFIGLGAMGGPMVDRLLAAQQKVVIWGRDPGKLTTWCDRGAELAPDPRTLAESVDLILLCVTDTEAVRAVTFDDKGIASAKHDALVVDHSTIHPLATREFAAELSERNGMAWLDAPVSGGVAGATNGTLVVMAGGTARDLERATPVLNLYSQRVTHMGGIGAGQATKVVNQMLIGGACAALAEALNYASNFGVSAHAIPGALADGWADSSVLQVHGKRMARADFSDEVDAAIMLKDLDIALDMGRETGSPMLVTALTQQLYRQLIANGDRQTGQSGLMRLYKKEPL